MKTTKELAGELGLIRKRTLKQGVGGTKDNRANAQHFPYLIVIDFESTCWKDKKNPNQEIIEFPAVLLNTSTGSIEDEFRTYCLPEEYPMLSSFCTELTGITQEQVESGIPLFLCLKKFSRWLKQLETEKGITYNFSSEASAKLCTFVTWSDWDLSVCLHYECQRKQLVKPEALKCWIDLRATYRKFYQRVPNGLEGALKDLGIQFEGRQHSGLDDARNTAYLSWRMICDGCQMKITKNMSSTGLELKSVGTGQKTSNNVTATSAHLLHRSTKVTLPVCQFSNRRKTSDLRSANMLQSLSASPELYNRSKLVHSNPAVTGCMNDASHGSTGKTNLKLGSMFKTPKGPGMKIMPESMTKTMISNSVYNTPNSLGSEFKTPEGPARTSSECLAKTIITDTRKSVKSCKRKVQSMETPLTMNTISNSVFETPNQRVQIVKITPPLCHCGKRSRKKNVFSPGPNQGRTYYSCCSRRRGKLQDVTNFTGGCGFFKWESVIIKGIKIPSLLLKGSSSI